MPRLVSELARNYAIIYGNVRTGRADIPSGALVSLSPEQVVRHAARAGHDLKMEPVEQLIG